MKVAISASGAGLEAAASPHFGRCPIYVFVDTETMAAESLENTAANAAGGAGIQAAQFVIGKGAEALISENLGPNAFEVFQAAAIPCYAFPGGTVRDAVEAFRAGKLASLGVANARAHGGMQVAQAAAPGDAEPGARAREVEDLKRAAGDLRKQLADIMERVEKLQKEG